MQSHSRQHQVEGLGWLSQVLDIAQNGLSRRALELPSRGLDHPRRTVDAPIARSAGGQQLASDLRVATAEVEHTQPRHRAELLKERRGLHHDVRIQRPGTVLLVTLEQLPVVVERAAAPITGVSQP
jgi:hypothetical protein